MITRTRQCTTFRQHREWILMMSQVDLARLAKVSQGRISVIENQGKLPKRRNWGPYLKAMKLTPKEFERLARGSRQLYESLKPMRETMPLFAQERDQKADVTQMDTTTKNQNERIA